MTSAQLRPCTHRVGVLLWTVCSQTYTALVPIVILVNWGTRHGVQVCNRVFEKRQTA